MLCEICKKNEATTHIKSNINGHREEKYLCEECAKKFGFTAEAYNPFSEMLASIFGDTVPKSFCENELKCDCCGTTFSQFVNTGKAGCGNCYTAFYDEILPYLKRIHGNVKHIGKTAYRTAIPTADEEGNIERLKKELNDAIKSENYEQAAVLRDKIKEAEGQDK